jgi:hypothetical protein
VQRQYHEQFTQRRPRRAAADATPVESPPPTKRRRWTAVLFATLVLVFAFTGVITALYEQDEGDTDAARMALALSVVMVPIAFTILARVSRAPHPFRTVSLVSPLAVAGYLAVGSLIRDPTSSLVLAFGVAGAFTLRIDPPQRIAVRLAAVTTAGVVVAMLALVSIEAAVVLAPFVPFPVLMLGDRIALAQSARTSPG